MKLQPLENKQILLIISGGIAAYKALELIRLMRKAGGTVKCILTNGGSRFITPLSVSALSENPVYTDLFSLKDESEMGHIRLSRESDLVVIAPASASMIAKMAHGLADDLASTVLLATNKPVMIAPAMNPMMWNHAATQDNLETLYKRGIHQIGPACGEMACGETGLGRMTEPEEICGAVINHFQNKNRLSGLKALVTSGPTYEPLDPVRFIGNRSSGKQGHALAKALRDRGADVTLVSGPVALPDPAGINTIHIETAQEMFAACKKALPADIAVCTAAVSDWAAEETQKQKIKKTHNDSPPSIALKENPDILASLARDAQRPALLIGFAAETENLLEEAHAKKKRKGCDWLVANNVANHGTSAESVFGADENHVYVIDNTDKETEIKGEKSAIAGILANKIASHFEKTETTVIRQDNVAAN